MLNPESLHQFIASMPARYSERFSVLDMQQHACIVQERGRQLAHVAQFTSSRPRGTGLCIVATDRPGLLAAISSALTRAGLGIVEAEIFTRGVTASSSEAVDLFWVTRRGALQHLEVASTDVRRVRHHLIELLGRSEPVAAARQSSFLQRAPDTSAFVRFIQDPRGRFTILEINANDRPGLFLAVCRAAFAARVQIVGSHFRAEAGRSQGRFELTELDETAPGTDRRQDIQMAILTAIDELARPAAHFAAG